MRTMPQNVELVLFCCDNLPLNTMCKMLGTSLILYVILFRNQPLTAATLVKGGADGNGLNKNKCSPLHVAVNKGYTDVVKTFLSCSTCDVNAQVCKLLHITL